MPAPLSYDITRLASRVFSASPNGVHRVDAALARHFLTQTDRPISAAWYPRPLAHRIVSRAAGQDVVEGVDGHFDERLDPRLEPHYRAVRDWVLRDGGPPAEPARLIHDRPRRLARALGWLRGNGVGVAAIRALPRGACYLNVSHYGLSVPGAFDWLARRPDVKAVFFLHDLLPLETPEYFRPSERARHETRLGNLARRGAGAIVSTRVVATALEDQLQRLGRRDLPILIAPPPVAPVFREPVAADDELRARPFFIQCGTIEPRKNHLTMLHVWRELVARHGALAPKLVLIGKRGWENENVIDLLERAPSLRGHVLEASGLPTPVLRRLLASARALLMPSFAEGFGLPLVEAIAAGTPAIASDIPVFREIAGGAFTAIDPIDGAGWLRAVEALCGPMPGPAVPPRCAEPDASFARVTNFIDSL
jgi:glycosyltransferase involved in cell wall biosynthesis